MEPLLPSFSRPQNLGSSLRTVENCLLFMDTSLTSDYFAYGLSEVTHSINKKYGGGGDNIHEIKLFI